MNCLLLQQQWSIERPGGDALPIQLVQQPRVVGVGAFLIRAGAVTTPQLVLKTRAFTFVQTHDAKAQSVIPGEVLYGRGDAVFVCKQSVGVGFSRPGRRKVDGNRFEEPVSGSLKLYGPEGVAAGVGVD